VQLSTELRPIAAGNRQHAGFQHRALKETAMKAYLYRHPIHLALRALVTVLFLMAPAEAGADDLYSIRTVVKFGDPAGDVGIKKSSNAFAIGGLNDRGQILFSTQPTEAPDSHALFQYADGQFTPILVAGREGLSGPWPQDIRLNQPPHMNQLGNVVFSAYRAAGEVDLGTLLWDAQTQRVTPVALKGMPATSSHTFASGGFNYPVINNRNEIAFPAQLMNEAGELWTGVFFRGQDEKLLPVALPGQELPDGREAVYTVSPSLNDTGMVAFLANREGDEPSQASAYLWEKGTISVLALPGRELSDGGKIASVELAEVNNKNRNVLLGVRLNDLDTQVMALYLLADGKLIPVAVPGRSPMPGSGTLRGIPLAFFGIFVVSHANDAGQHAFIAALEDGTTAAYLMDADGKLSLIVKSSTATELGRIKHVGRGTGRSLGVALNNRGQVALPVQLESGGDAILLLTPVSP
jgi:hypothetical protein